MWLSNMIYFDNSSTTSVRPEVLDVYTKLLKDTYGNPDSLHALGRRSHQLLEKSRANIAQLLHVNPSEIIFTGCASESNSLAIIGYGFEIDELKINEQGIVTPETVKNHMRKDTILVSIMHVNNEVGSINPIKEIEKIVHSNPICAFHVDCVQSFSKIDVPFEILDMATISAHKIHGLKGSALLMKKNKIQLVPLIQGGQQEQGLRGGTENAPANIVLAKTIRLALEEQEAGYKHVKEINEYIRKEIMKIPNTQINSPDDAIPYILNISLDMITSEVLLNALDQKGICVSAKSTCSSHSSNASSVLLAMNKSQKSATHMIRLSFDKNNTLEEAKQFIKACKEIVKEYGLSL